MPENSKTKKLVLVLATSSSITETNKEEYISLEWVSCINYPLRFLKDTVDIRALIDSRSEVNAITPAYASKLALKVYPTILELRKLMVLPLTSSKWSWRTSS